MTQRSAIEALQQTLQRSGELTTEQMRELINSLKQLKSTMRREEDIVVLDEAIYFLEMQADTSRNKDKFRRSIASKCEYSFLEQKWQSISSPIDIGLSAWRDLRLITQVACQLEEPDLLDEHALLVINNLRYYIYNSGRSENPQNYITKFLSHANDSCNSQINNEKLKNHREVVKYYALLKKLVENYWRSINS
jgi:hypothetical protein